MKNAGRQAGRQAGVSGQSSSPIARAIAELETERRNLQSRLGKVDDAIASLRALFHLPAPTEPKPKSEPRASTPAPRSSSNGGDTVAAIRAALSHGPLSPGALAKAVGLDRPVLRIQLRALERDGVVVSTGTTVSRRVALASAAAKEGL